MAPDSGPGGTRARRADLYIVLQRSLREGAVSVSTAPRVLPYDPARVKVIACATVIEEMAPRMPDSMAREVLDFGLHFRPEGLTAALQSAIDASPGFETILLGYGLCSRGVVGLRATTARLVIPKVDDCIAIFLGSRADYQEQHDREPGTYYVTKGWVEAKDTPLDVEEELRKRWDARKAHRMVRLMLKNYTRLAFIETGAYEAERYRERAKECAARYDLRYEEIEGKPGLVERLLFGPWDEECVVVEPGGVVHYEQFVKDPKARARALPGFARGWAGGRPAGGRPAGGRPTGGRPAGGRPAGARDRRLRAGGPPHRRRARNGPPGGRAPGRDRAGVGLRWRRHLRPLPGRGHGRRGRAGDRRRPPGALAP
jgi:hypothetical protein